MRQGYFTVATPFGAMFLDVRSTSSIGIYLAYIHGMFDVEEVKKILGLQEDTDSELEKKLKDGVYLTEDQLVQILKHDGAKRHFRDWQ